jgi:phosphohistidine swiveling domain-containing protein
MQMMALSARDAARSTEPTVVLTGLQFSPGVVGGKGAALDRLIGSSIPVPTSGVVTTAAYRAFVDVPVLHALIGRIRSDAVISTENVDAAFRSVSFSDDLREQIVATARRVGGGERLAIRSSATVEDLAGSSFAGQYRSLLDVDPAEPDAVLDAVRMVFASLWHPAPCAYRKAFGIDETDVEMAAVMMRMVAAETAGVVFTRDPGGGALDARIESVEGLGDTLVAGERTPHAWIVRRSLQGFDGSQEIAEALRLSLEIERLEGSPQDVEWAYDGALMWIVQTRPITVAGESSGDGFDDPVDAAELTTAGIDEMLPGVFPPLRWEIASHLFNEAFSRLVEDLGGRSRNHDDDRRFVRRVRGRVAMDFDALRDLAQRLPGGSVDELELQYFGSQRRGGPAAPALADTSRWSVLRHDVKSLTVRKRSSLDAEIVVHAVDVLGSGRDVASLTSRDLAAYQFRLIDLAVRAAAAELAVASSAASSYRKIELLLAPHLGDVEAGSWTERITSGYGITVAPDADASAAVFAGPTWTELGRSPPTEADLHRDGDSSGSDEWDPLISRLRATASWGERGLVTAMRTRALRHVVAETTTLLRRREATKAALLRLGGEVRRTMLEQGARLVERGALDDPADIELMTMNEIRSAFAGHPVPPNSLAGRRRWLRRSTAEPPLPRVFVGVPEYAPVELPEGGRLDGWAASPGRYTGTATVVSDPGGKFEPGAILVAEATDASWSPLFLKAGAIVVDCGGPLSHAAILARELGVPAVLNVQGASRTLDGHRLTVDGDAGIVVVLDSADDEATVVATEGLRP